MNHAISPVSADLSAHMAATARREAEHSYHDQLQDQYRDELEADPKWLLELIEDGPLAQRQAFCEAAVRLLTTTGSDFMRGPLAELATPLQEIIRVMFAERADKQIEAERQERRFA